MTNRIDRPAERGLVERRPNLADRRGVRVRLTADGSRLVGQALADLLRFEEQVLTSLTPEQRSRLADHVRDVLEPFESDE